MQITLTEQKEASTTFDCLYSKFSPERDQLVAVAQFKDGEWIGEVCKDTETAQYRGSERYEVVEQIEKNHDIKLKFKSSKENWYEGIPLPGDIFEIDSLPGTLEMLGKTPGADKYELQWILPDDQPERIWFQWSKSEIESHHFMPA